MHPRTSEFLHLPYAIRVVPDDCTDDSTCYFARVVELEGCESHADTPQEAVASIREAMALFIDSMLEDGLEPPRPEGTAPMLILEVMDVEAGPSTTEAVWTSRSRTIKEDIPAMV